MVKVTWTPIAILDYEQIINYLLREWSQTVAQRFVDTLEERVELLKKFPRIGIASSEYSAIRSIVITKHNKLFYRISDNEIQILNIFDTPAKPE